MSALRDLAAKLFIPLQIHGLNQHEALQRAVIAKANNLDPATYGTPYPGGSNSSNTTTTTHTVGGVAKGVLLTAGLIAAAGAGVGVTKMLQPSQSPVTAQPVGGEAYDAIVEEQQLDGSWKPISKTRINPPGK